MEEMTSRERVLTTLGQKEPDRVPLFAFAVDPKFTKMLSGKDSLKAYDALDLDVFPMPVQSWCQGIPLMAPLFMDIPAEDQTGGGVFAGWNGVDEYGRIWKRGSYIGGALANRDDIDKFIPPLRLEERISPRAMEKYRKIYPNKAYSTNIHLGPFGLTLESMGFEHFFYTLYDDLELIKEILDRRTQWFIDVCLHAQSLGSDFVVMGDDVAFKGSTFVSPDQFNELAIPCYHRIVDALDIPVIWHSDGYIESLLNLAIEADIKGIHAIEPLAGNDLGRIKEKYGDKLVLIGNVDCAQVLTSDDLDLVRKEVDRCMQQAKKGGGYMIDASNSLHSGCNFDAVLEMYRYAKKVGIY
jgi:uroporphyrinogen decarboxylase